MDEAGRGLRLTNLNLLPTLRAVLKHRNLTRAAEELNLTQSAVSNSLRRLREHFGDDLLVRDGRRLRLTDKARRLVGPLEAALASLQDVLADAPFDPARSTRRFRIATADYVTAISIPRIATFLAKEAPAASVQTLTARGGSIADLRVETIDLVISPRQVIEAAIYDAPKVLTEIEIEPLGREPFVCLARADDPSLSGVLTVEAYLARPHASFSLDIEVHASLERAFLLEHGISQFDRILTSDFTILPLIAAGSDCLALTPRSLARLAMQGLPLRAVPMPLAVPDLELVMVWSRRRRAEADLAWFRDLVRRGVEPALRDD